MIEELTALGLEYYEAKAFVVLLKDKMSLDDISRKSGIPFGKVYSVIKKLKEKGIVLETNSRPKLVYIENASEIIGRLIQEKQEKDKRLNEKLRVIATEFDKAKNKPTKFLNIGVNNEENRQIQMRSFSEANEEVLQIINIHHKPKSNRESKTMWEKEISKAVIRGVVFKSIYPKEAVLPRILQELNKKYPLGFQVRRFNSDFIRTDIIDRKKVLLKIVGQDPLQFGGVLFIENERLAENLIKIFYELWEQAD
jgi:sugar-specific transcriptional regulator TrmB